MSNKWVVSVDIDYYPDITEFDEYELALKDYESKLEYYEGSDATIYLSEVKESRKFES